MGILIACSYNSVWLGFMCRVGNVDTRVPLVVIETPAVCPCGLAAKALGTGWSGRAAETSLQTPIRANKKSHQTDICEKSSHLK